MLNEPLQVVARIARTFDDLSIRYAVGGSLASSIHGLPRATQDVDILAEIAVRHVEALANALGNDFYVDVAMIRDAIERRASFNVVEFATMFKADIFLPSHDDWSREELSRAKSVEFSLPDGKAVIRFASPEDTLLHKLLWFRLGNEVSDRQWSDIDGVLKVQGASLDIDYLETWAPSLNVLDLLHRARNELASESGRETS